VGQETLVLRSGGAVTIQRRGSWVFCSPDGKNRIWRASLKVEHEGSGNGK
jgi:hypothetical protein